jgi:hypothetical protein
LKVNIKKKLYIEIKKKQIPIEEYLNYLTNIMTEINEQYGPHKNPRVNPGAREE